MCILDLTSTVYPFLPISALHCGEIAEIQQVLGPHEQVQRLEELGFRMGVVLEMIRTGSPCIIRIGSSTLCIREDQYLQVLVAPRKTA
jgi:ferrous iron transport protein A